MDRHRSRQGALPVRASNSPCGPRSGTGAKRHPFEAPLELPAPSVGRPRLAASWWRGQRAAGCPVHDARRAQVPYEALQDVDSQPFTSWKTTNLLRLFSGRKRVPDATHFFLFSTGGGTGSGMSIEVGTAQGFLTHKRQKELTKAPSGNPGASLLAKTGPPEARSSIGLGIMLGRTQEIDAQALNTGRGAATTSRDSGDSPACSIEKN